MSRIHDIPLLLLVVIAAALAIIFWVLGFSWLAADIAPGGTYLLKSIAGLAKDALFVPLKPLMYTLIILSIGSSLAISTTGSGDGDLTEIPFLAKIYGVLTSALMISIYAGLLAGR